jgi:hypothetical protein
MKTTSQSSVFPPPFSAEQIRAATQNGRMYRFRVELEGKPTVLRTMTFTNVSEEGADLTSLVTLTDGTSVAPATTKRVTFRELQSHAEFPAARVTRSEETIDLAELGSVHAIRYQVEGAEAGDREVYYFDPSKPGAPVFFYEEQKKKRVTVSKLVAYADK